MARSLLSIRNPEAVLGTETYRMGWKTVRLLLIIWIPVQLIAAFTEFGRQISVLALLLLTVFFWLYSVPRVIRMHKPSQASTAGLTLRVFGRHILPGAWVGISAAAPATVAAGIVVSVLVIDDASFRFRWSPILFVLAWYVVGSALNLLIFGLSGGWRVSLLNLGGSIAGMIAGVLCFFLGALAHLDFSARFFVLTFLGGQIAILPAGVAVMGWAIRATLGRAQERAGVSPARNEDILKVEIPPPPVVVRVSEPALSAEATAAGSSVLKIQLPPTASSAAPPAPAAQPLRAPPRPETIVLPAVSVPQQPIVSAAPPPPVVSRGPETATSPSAVRNFGTRQDTVEQADAYWLQRLTLTTKDPYVLYSFPEAHSARNALLAIPCMALDANGKLACSQVLTFGFYLTKSGAWEAFLGGDLSPELWKQAKASMSKYGGQAINELAPAARPTESEAAPLVLPGTVTFVETHQRERGGVTMTYVVYQAPNAATAKEFLAGQDVKERFKYLMVDTPDGRFGRDIDGIFKEPG